MRKFIVLLFILYGCAPKVIVKNHIEGQFFPPTHFYESFAVFEEGDYSITSDDQLIADIEVKDNGLSVNCDYETVKRMAEKRARDLGGNCMVITEHKEPGLSSTCHRIKAQVYKIINPEDHEKYVLWHQNRPLSVRNFRGTISKRPFQAATYTMIQYFATKIDGKKTVFVESLFDCNLSYFKPSVQDSAVLAHEQVHFDITELYARKFRKKIKEETTDYDDFLSKHESIFSDILHELSLKQDEYDSEVYTARSQQSKWDKWIADELAKLINCEKREVILD